MKNNNFERVKNNKLLITFGVVFILILSGSSVFGLTRTITDTGDDVSTFIRNSNGNYWAATGANIQSAIDDLSNGGTVTLPEGTFAISTAVTVGDNVHLTGQGTATVLVLADGSDCDVIENSNRSNGNDNITISNLKVNANKHGQTGTKHYQGITLAKCNHSTIKDVFVTNSYEAGIFLYDGFFNMVDSCRITNAGDKDGGSTSRSYGVSLEGENNSGIFNCYAENIGSAAFNFGKGRTSFPATKAQQPYNCSVIGCNAYNCSSGIWTEKLYYGVISNNVVTDCEDWGFGIDPKGISVFGGSHLTIDGNVFRDADSTLEGLWLQNCYSSVISNNVIENIAGGDGIKSQGDCDYNIINGNYIENVDDDGIYVITGENVTISDNTIKDAGEWGIHVYDNNCTVSDNLISGVVLYDGIKLEALNGCIISNNVLSDINRDGITVQNSRDVIVTGNLDNHLKYLTIQYNDLNHLSQ